MKSKIILLFLLLVNILNANEAKTIIYHDDLLDKRAQDKINEIAAEVKAKLKVNLYAFVREDNGINTDLPRKERQAIAKKKEQELRKNLVKPYALLTMAINQKYINILTSPDLKEIIDKDDVLDNYVIPLLASKDRNTLFAKTSAATLNGIAQIADSIASARNIKLDSSIGSEGKTAGTIWRVFMYTLVIIGIVSYTVIILREKKYKKETK